MCVCVRVCACACMNVSVYESVCKALHVLLSCSDLVVGGYKSQVVVVLR